jgi:diguanylate cyclase (GGDEF)-like protein
MAIDVDYKQVTAIERRQIDGQIKLDLVEHLYKSNVTAVLTGVLTSICFFMYYYNHTGFIPLLSWFIGFNLALTYIAGITLMYRKNRNLFDVNTWEIALAVGIMACAILWGVSVLFSPDDLTHQYLLFAILFMLSAAYSMGTVGLFYLGVACLCCILIPITVWCFVQRDFYYNLGGSFVILYFIFLMGMNKRSSEWLKDSLKLKLENSYFTHQANHDLLTDLPNQRSLLRLIENAIRKRRNTKQGFALICFSINRLEMFNNSLGYQAGDLIVQSLTKRLSTLLSDLNRQDPKIDRLLTLPRPDAFVILMDPLPVDTMPLEIEQLFTVLDLPFYLGKREAKLTVSSGVCVFPEDGDNARVLMSNAYAAMFQAKQRGGNQIEYYKREINEKTPYLLELETDLHHAVKHNEFVVYYQPLVDLESGHVFGMEALIRWQHPKRGMVQPIDFIPLAEETGLILPMGAWILEEACRKTKQWNEENFKSAPLKVSVNLSVKQLRQGNLLETIDHILVKTQLKPEFLDLELTETELLDENLLPIMKEITNRGVSLSIDDFGTGYSGLSYLRFINVHKIKIDKSFIDDVTTNEESATIVSAILAMARELNIKTLAEGVETKEQLKFLQDRGCQCLQGYYFSKPLPWDEFAKLLQDQKHL